METKNLGLPKQAKVNNWWALRGWRKKKLPVEVFSTTGAVLLFCASARADVSKSYKTSVRSEVALMSEAFFGIRLTKQDELPREFEPMKIRNKKTLACRNKPRLITGGR